MNNTTLSSDNPLRFTRTIKTSISKKNKEINSKIEQKKSQYNIDRQTAKISALSLKNISKYEFLTDKDVLPEKSFLEKVAKMKRFELDKIVKKEKPTIKKYNRSNFICISKCRFYEYCNNKNFDRLCFEPKHPIPGSFCNEFNKCNNQKPQKENREREKKTVYNNA